MAISILTWATSVFYVIILLRFFSIVEEAS